MPGAFGNMLACYLKNPPSAMALLAVPKRAVVHNDALPTAPKTAPKSLRLQAYAQRGNITHAFEAVWHMKTMQLPIPLLTPSPTLSSFPYDSFSNDTEAAPGSIHGGASLSLQV